jgi:tetratricopeptide (TPR) repeat protein
LRLRFQFFALLSALTFSAPASISLEESLLRDGRVDEAISTLNSRLSKSASDAEAYHLLARAHFSVGNYEAAITASEKAVSLAPSSAKYRLWLGRAYGRRAEEVNFIRASSLARRMRTEFEKAIAIDGNDVAARTDLAEFYIEAPGIVGGGKDKARREAEIVARTDSATAHWIKARVAEKEGDSAAAETEYKSAVADSSSPARNWLSLASFYRRQGRFDDMQQAITKAVSADGAKNSSIFYDAATLLWRARRNLPDAVQYLRRYLAAENKSEEAPVFEAHYFLGQMLEAQGDKAAARREYEAALKLARDYAKAKNALAKLR